MAPNQTALLERVEKNQKQELNQTCAECYQRDSCWASIIHAPISGGVDMGIFICGRCYKHHSALGAKYVVVKSLSVATPWTEEEVKIMERSGNVLVNAIFEAKLPDKDRDTLKEIITSDRKEEAEARLEFVTRKYKDLKYFCEKEYKRKSVEIWKSKEEEENEDDDPDEKARDRRRSMMLGGSHSMRLSRTTDAPANDISNLRSTAVATRSQGVLNRAASRRSLAIKKSNSARNLMGRLNNIELGSTSTTKTTTNQKEDKQLENSSTDTAETEDSESSEEQDTALPASYWDDPPKAAANSATTDSQQQQQSSSNNGRQDSLKGLLTDSNSPGRGSNLNNLAHIPRRSMSSRNLMQLPTSLQVQKGSNTMAAQDAKSRLRKSMSARNLMGRVDQQASSSNNNNAETGGPKSGQLKKSLSSRSMHQRKSVGRPDDLLQKSFSGRSLTGGDGNKSPNNHSLQGQYNAAITEFDSSLDNTTKDGPGGGGLQKSLSMKSIGTMRKSFSSRSLQRPKGLRKTLSGDDSLVMVDGDFLLAGDNDNNNEKSPSESLQEQHNASLKEFNSSMRGLRKSFSIKDMETQQSNRDLMRRSMSSKDLQTQLSKKNLMRRSASTRDLPTTQGPEKRSTSDPLSIGDPDSAVQGTLKKSPSNGSLMRPQMRTRPNEPLRKSFSGRSLTMNNATDAAGGVPMPIRKLSMKNVMKDQEPDNNTTNPAAGKRSPPRRAKSMKGFGDTTSGRKGSLHSRQSLEMGDDKQHQSDNKRGGLRKSMSMRGFGDGSPHSSRMQRTSSRRSLLTDNAGGDNSKRMERRLSRKNLTGEESSHSKRMERSSSRRSLLKGDNAGDDNSKRMERRLSRRNLTGEESSHSKRMERSSSRRSLLKGDNSGDDNSKRMERRSSRRNLTGEESSHSKRMERSSSRRSLSMNLAGEESGNSKRMERSSSRRSLSMNLSEEGSSQSKRMERSSSRRSLSMNLEGEGSTHKKKLERPASREKSILMKDLSLDADTLCPSRRDLYDPDAKGLALLLQDSSMNFNYKHGRNASQSLSPMRPQRYASPTRSGKPVDMILEECDESKWDDSRRNSETQGRLDVDRTSLLDKDKDKEDSDHSSDKERENTTRKSGLIRRIDSKAGLAMRRSSSSDDAPSESRSHRERRSSNEGGSRSHHERRLSVSPRRYSNGGDGKSFHKRERRQSRSPSSRDLRSSRSPSSRDLGSRRDSLGGSNDSRHNSKHHSRRDSLGGSNNSRHNKHHSRRDRRDSVSPTRRSSRHDSHHHRSSHKDSRHHSRHSRDRSLPRRRDSDGTDFVGFYKEVDSFIESVGCDVNDEDFWWRMVEKWTEAA